MPCPRSHNWPWTIALQTLCSNSSPLLSVPKSFVLSIFTLSSQESLFILRFMIKNLLATESLPADLSYLDLLNDSTQCFLYWNHLIEELLKSFSSINIFHSHKLKQGISHIHCNVYFLMQIAIQMTVMSLYINPIVYLIFEYVTHFVIFELKASWGQQLFLIRQHGSKPLIPHRAPLLCQWLINMPNCKLYPIYLIGGAPMTLMHSLNTHYLAPIVLTILWLSAHVLKVKH